MPALHSTFIQFRWPPSSEFPLVSAFHLLLEFGPSQQKLQGEQEFRAFSHQHILHSTYCWMIDYLKIKPTGGEAAWLLSYFHWI